ncbi:MAG: hemolysin III family protein [Lewinellaceae bacterium]|nr:hemolysin III family protein [Lewinellaceae bacterium]MCB9354093.1 hemolysin III family protein [Lewinellaceae bacterium]
MDSKQVSIQLKQELANSISHGFGILFGIVGVPILIVAAARAGDTAVAGAGIYGFCFLMVYTCSTLYHGLQHPEAKRVLKIIDHISIYFLIAGSYTPFVLLFVYNTTGLVLLGLLWGLAFAGIFFKIYHIGKRDRLSTAVYVLMGWMLIPVSDVFFAELSRPVVALIISGGVLYSIGVVFYLWRKFTYHHVVWHIFVLTASICHYSAILMAISQPVFDK